MTANSLSIEGGELAIRPPDARRRSRHHPSTWAWIEAQKRYGDADIFRFRFDRALLTGAPVMMLDTPAKAGPEEGREWQIFLSEA